MQPILRIRLVVLVLIALFALAACQVPAQTGAGAAGTPTSGPTETASPVPPTASPSTGGTPTPGAVTLVLNKSSYRPDDTIEVTIKNGLATDIFPLGQHTNCMFIQLEFLDNGVWKDEGSCRLVPPTQPLSLAPGSSTIQILAHGTGLNSAGPWPAGTYRAALAYQTVGGSAAGQQTLVYSAHFVVS
jgi:hypothetical protein